MRRRSKTMCVYAVFVWIRMCTTNGMAFSHKQWQERDRTFDLCV